MAKKKSPNWRYLMLVGFHLFVLSIIPMIVGSVFGLVMGLLVGGVLAMIAEFAVGFALIGYFVVKYRKWLFKDSLI